MSALGDKLRRARESTVDCDGMVFTIRRPTDIEAWNARDKEGIDVVCGFVVGWNLTELQLGLPGGSGVPVEFDADALREFLSDRPELIRQLSDAVTAAYVDHANKRGEAEKN